MCDFTFFAMRPGAVEILDHAYEASMTVAVQHVHEYLKEM
jgi:hypothetical protein